jgi:hypothetical protein
MVMSLKFNNFIMLPAKIVLQLPESISTEGSSGDTPTHERTDSYLYLNNEIIPVVRSRLRGCGLLAGWQSSSRNIFCILEDLDVLPS